MSLTTSDDASRDLPVSSRNQPRVSPQGQRAESGLGHGIHVDTDEIVTALPGAELSPRTTSQQRYLKWRQAQPKRIEFLIPRIIREITAQWPAYMDHQRGHLDLSREQLVEQVRLLGPWYVPFRLGHDVSTIDITSKIGRENVEGYLFRRDLINATVAEVLGEDFSESTVLDIGCNSGFFSLDLAARGAKHVDGVDLREANIERARFVAEHFGIENTEFRVSDADEIASGRQWDVVLNLGLLYHVVNPLQLIQQTFDLCSKFAIIDTVVHFEPISAYILFGDKDNQHLTEGREEWEFHPTYRAAIETIRYAGFSEVIEIVGKGEPEHPLYSSGARRCFLALK
jgi:SAM-dependent methyltransferase